MWKRKGKKRESGKFYFLQKFKLKWIPLEVQTIHVSHFILICDEILTIAPTYHGHSVKVLLLPHIRVSLGLVFLSPLSFILGFCWNPEVPRQEKVLLYLARPHQQEANLLWYHLSMTTSARGSLTPTTAHPLALLHPSRRGMNPEAFTPKTVENLASLSGYLEKEESLSSAKGCLPCWDYCWGRIWGQSLPLYSLVGESWFQVPQRR